METCAGSTVNKGTGRLSHSQKIFSTNTSQPLSLALALNYHSQDFAPSAIGNGWSHSYEMSLQNGAGNSKIFWQGGKRRVYESYNTGYVSPKGDYSNLVQNGDGSFTLTEKSGFVRQFDNTGVATSIVDRNGNSLIFTYAAGQLASVTDANSRTANFAYDGNGKLTTITDPQGNAYSLAYAGAQLASIINPDTTHWGFVYAGNGLLASKTDPSANSTTYTYDTENRLSQAADPVGKTRSFALGGGGSGTAQVGKVPDVYPAPMLPAWNFISTEKDENDWTYTFDARTQRVLSKIDPLGNTTSFSYDRDGNVLSKTEPGIGTTTYTYDGQGNVLSVTDPLGQITTFIYNGYGQVLSVNGAPGSYVITYDAAGNLGTLTNPAGETRTYSYDAAGNLTSIANPLGQVLTLAYDGNNNLISSTLPGGAVTQFTYDANGNLLTVTNPLGKVTTFAYDSRNRPITVTDPQGNVSSVEYDGNGNPVSLTDASGKVTTYQYNFQGQATQVQDALNQITALSYGEAGCPSCSGVDQLNSVTDAKSQQTSFSYDQLGRLVTTTDPLGLATTYSYGATKNPTAITAPDITSISYAYDALQRLTQKTYPDATTATYAYDSRGNLTSSANASVSYSYVYDAANRLTSATDSRGFTIAYQYDAAGKRTSTTLQPGTSDEQVIGYSYDTINRLTGMSSPAGAFGFGYDLLNRRTRLDYPNGISASYSYDLNTGWLTGIDYQSLGLGIAYPQHDAVGNRLSRSEDGTTTAYAYDDIYQITQAKTGPSEENFVWDAVGNRRGGPTVKEVTDATYVHNFANQMEQGRKYSYEYDARGNQTRKYLSADQSKRWEFVWNGENQLTQAKLVNGATSLRTVSFKYDPFGRRIEKQVSQSGDTLTTRYVYDGEDIILQTQSDGTTTTVTPYVHGPGIDEPLAMIKDGGQPYYYHTDGLGSIVAITDASGNIVQRYSYEAFGQLTAEYPSFDNIYTYTGREYDKETGLYYYRARYYDAMEGRFISKDPIAIGGNIYTQGVNVPFSQYISAVTSPYRYTENNPTNLVDPWGLWSLTIDIYFPYGGGLILGQNADGSAFLTLRAGVGYGGGVSFSPEGGSPGYDPCQTEQDFNASLGFFAEAAAQYGPGKIGASKRDGLHSINLKEAYPYRDNDFYDPAVAAPAAGGLRGSAAMGFEGGFVWKY
jgi:RHS repeat-associated protein